MMIRKLPIHFTNTIRSCICNITMYYFKNVKQTDHQCAFISILMVLDPAAISRRRRSQIPGREKKGKNNNYHLAVDRFRPRMSRAIDINTQKVAFLLPVRQG